MAAQARLSREESKALTRQKLISAARKIFLERGFHAASLDEIALEASVTKGAVYSNFANKGELFMAVLDHHIEQRLLVYQSVTFPEEGLEAVARKHACVMLAQGLEEAKWISLQAEVWAYASSNPELQKELAQRRDQMLDGMFVLVQKLAETADVTFVLPTREMARAGQALLRGLLLERLLGEEAFSDRQFADTFAAFVSGMARPAQEKEKKSRGRS